MRRELNDIHNSFLKRAGIGESAYKNGESAVYVVRRLNEQESKIPTSIASSGISFSIKLIPSFGPSFVGTTSF